MERLFESYGNLPTQNMEPVSEAYIGKTKLLVAVEKELDILIKQRKNSVVTYDMSSDSNPHVKAVSELLQKQFGFKECVVNFVPYMVVNACTIHTSIISRTSNKKSYVFDKRKGHYDSEHSMSVFISVFDGLFEIEDMTGGMLLAIMLHEIGHNFDNSPWVAMQEGLEFVMSPLAGLINIILRESNVLQRAFTIISDFIYRVPTLEMFVKLYSWMTSLSSSMIRLFEKITFVHNVLFGVEGKVNRGDAFLVITKVLHEIAGAPGELHADELAAVYGYGAELSDGLTALRHSQITIEGLASKSSVSNFLVDMYSVMYKTLYMVLCPESIINCHPSEQARVRNIIIKYERDLANKDFPPEMKKELMRQLEQTREIYDGYIACSRDGEKGKLFSKAIRMFKDKVTGGKDWHNIMPMKHL